MFITPTGSDTTGNGSQEKPFASLAKALKFDSAKTFVLAPGTYSGPFVLPAGATVHGGWLLVAGAWQRDCSDDARSKVILTSTALNTPVVSVSTVGVTVTDLTIKTKEAADPAAPDTSGESLIGVLVSGASSTLALTNVEVVSGKAGDGGQASEAKPGSVGMCDGVTDCADGSDGLPGADGLPGEQGTFTSSGFVAGDGKSGMVGMPGKNGVKGGMPNELACAKCEGQTSDTCKGITSYTIASHDGACGCGALAGEVGKPGPGGGASVGILVGQGAVIASSSRISSSDGGISSSGAIGSAELEGSLGHVGADSDLCKSDNGVAKCLWSDNQCVVTNTMEKSIGGGSPGMKGGSAGKSGKGGPGAGGPSFAVVTVGTATYTPTQTTLAHGKGGVGADGAPGGAAQDIGTF